MKEPCNLRKNPMVVLMEKVNPNIETPFYNVTEINERKVLAAGMDVFARKTITIPPYIKLYEKYNEFNEELLKMKNEFNSLVDDKDISIKVDLLRFAMMDGLKPERIIPLNIKLVYPENTLAFLLPRSSLCLEKHLRVCNSIGLIDESFRSEHGLIVENAGFETVTIEEGEKIAQLVFMPTFPVNIELVKSIEESKHRGYGSTGGYKK